MKKSIYLLTLLFFLFLNAHAQQTTVQWEQPLLVTNGAQYGSNRPRIALTETDSAIIVWGHGNNIRLSRRTANGFTHPLQINQATFAYNTYWTGPEIDAQGDHVFVTYNSSNINSGIIYSVRSNNGAHTMEVPVLLPSLPNTISFLPTVGIDTAGNPSVIYMENGAGWVDPRYVVIRSIDGGDTWLPRIDVSAGAPHEVCDCCPAKIIKDGQNVVTLFRNNDLDLRDMWTVLSTNGGVSYNQSYDCDSANWNFPACPSSGPDAIFSQNRLYSVWMSQIAGASRIMVSAAGLNNNSLIPEASHVLVDNVPAGTQVNYPRIAGQGDTLGIIWQEVVGNKGRLMFMHSTNGLAGLSHPDTLWQGLNDNLRSPDIAYSNGNFYIVWDNQTSQGLFFRKGIITQANGITEPQITRMGARAFPNPFGETLTLDFEEFPADGSVLELYDLNGKLCHSQNVISQNVKLRSSGLEPGIYFWQLKGMKQGSGMVVKISKNQ